MFRHLEFESWKRFYGTANHNSGRAENHLSISPLIPYYSRLALLVPQDKLLSASYLIWPWFPCASIDQYIRPLISVFRSWICRRWSLERGISAVWHLSQSERNFPAVLMKSLQKFRKSFLTRCKRVVTWKVSQLVCSLCWLGIWVSTICEWRP